MSKKKKKLPPVAGRKILFVGGPEAGNVRIVPESEGDTLLADDDWVYRIWPMRIAGGKDTMYFAFQADKHPLQLYLDMWREYAPAAQIKRKAGMMTYHQAIKTK